MEKTWSAILSKLRKELSPPAYQTFLSSTKMIGMENNVMSLEVPNDFSKEWIKEKCEPLICLVLQKPDDAQIVIEYVVSSDTSKPEVEQLPIFETRKKESYDSLLFNRKYTFENFVVGHNNRFAYAASEAVAKAPSKAYNPLFIYGSAGLGKTHLLHAIGNKILETKPKLVLHFASSERFTNELINGIKDKRMDSFRKKYRNVDVLLVDDIQFLAGKEQTQEEFFHTFNELHGRNKQIILTSDRPPKEIPTLEERLRTRFEWGLIADIQPPEFETRIAILRKKIELNNLTVSDEILHFIATQIPTNVREMEGALTRIVAYASLLNTEVTLSIASDVIKDMVGVKREKPLTIAQIKRKVSDYFQISDSDLCSKSRIKDVTFARQVAMYLARELTNVSLPKIGESFGNRDHTTVMHACDKIKVMMKQDDQTKSVVNLLVANVRTN